MGIDCAREEGIRKAEQGMDVRGKYSFLALLLKGVHGQKKCLFLVPNFRGQDATENNIRLHAAVRSCLYLARTGTRYPVQARSTGIHHIWCVEAAPALILWFVLR
jgi:hypothetical protein